MSVWPVVAVVLAVCVLAEWFVVARTKDQQRQTVEAHLRLQGEYALLLSESERARWAEWWARCAAETTLADPSRPTVIRWALAAQRSELERVHAQAFANELGLRKRNTTPWVEWQKQPIVHGQPLHNPIAIEAAYGDALRSWDALLRPAHELRVNVPALQRSPPH